MNAVVLIATALGGIIIGVLCAIGYMQNNLWAKLDTAQRSFDRIETKIDELLRLTKGWEA